MPDVAAPRGNMSGHFAARQAVRAGDGIGSGSSDRDPIVLGVPAGLRGHAGTLKPREIRV